jgi:hypothetical protein
VQDAVVALQSAIDELKEAQQALPDDLGTQVQEVIQHTQTVLETVRMKIQTG